MTDTLLIHPYSKKMLNNVVSNPVGSYALVGEIGTGKFRLAKQLSLEILNTSNLDISRNYVLLNGLDAGIGEVRELQKKISFKSTESSSKRVVLISDFDMLGHESQNAMLKTLEEPPLDTLILITVSNKNNILDTVYSRVKTIEIKPIGYDQAVEFYNNSFTEPEIKRAYLMSDGLSLIMDEIIKNEQTQVVVKAIDIAKSLLSKSRYEKLIMVDKIIKSNDVSPEYVSVGLIKVLHASYMSALSKGSPPATLKTLADKLKLCLETNSMIKTNVSSKLLLTRLFLSL